MALQTRFQPNGNATLQYAWVPEFRLKAGPVVPQARISYCVWGQPGRPVIVLHPGVAGSVRALAAQEEVYADGWWNRYIGPGRLLDTDAFQVVCFGHFGGNGPSSSADELAPFAADLNVLDTASLAAQALRRLGVDEVHASIGTSMGAAIAREWLFQEQVGVRRVVEIFGKHGNNHCGSPAVCSHKIHHDIMTTDGGNLGDIRRRFVECFGPMRGETHAFGVVYDHVLAGLDALHEQITDRQALRVARMSGYFRFVTPLYFQQKWDAVFQKTWDRSAADRELRAMMDRLAESFMATFTLSGYASLRRMDAQPSRIPPQLVADALKRHDAGMMSAVVRGDRLYDPDLQIDEFRQIRDRLPHDRQDRMRLLICHDPVRGHDHFLSEAFEGSAREIRAFLHDDT